MGSAILGGVVPLGAEANETFRGLECHCLGKKALLEQQEKHKESRETWPQHLG